MDCVQGRQPKLRSAPPDPHRSTVMTDSPPPSGRPESAQMALLVLLRPVLFAIATIGMTLGALVLLPHGSPPPPLAPVQVAETVLPEPDPAPPVDANALRGLSAADLKGFQ